MKVVLDMIGQRFGRLVVISKAEKPVGSNRRRNYWLCQCDCGKQKVVASDKLLNGDTKSCGCLKIELAKKKLENYKDGRTTHGLSATRLYNIYNKMKNRCYKTDDPKYYRYGARGITVCEEWLASFRSFYDWAIANGYSDELTIDRIDNDGNYCPENCRWATSLEQQNNRSTNRLVSYEGEMVTIAEAARRANIPLNTLWWRTSQGWSNEKLFSKVRKRGV